MILLGQKARDKVTGFEGIVIGYCQYLYSGDQYCLMPPAIDNRIEPAQWFDEQRLEVVGFGLVPPRQVK